ncbi:MAG: hypothetical protein ICV65_01445 [Flavisolibacter sp.]|nr:hypothetical protein [Flavisolibacter sp.]
MFFHSCPALAILSVRKSSAVLRLQRRTFSFSPFPLRVTAKAIMSNGGYKIRNKQGVPYDSPQ